MTSPHAAEAGPPARPRIEILLVEDSEPDVLLTQEAFEGARVPNQVHVVRDGVEALRFLRREGEYASSPRPDVILLDINMPRKNGLEVLGEIKADPALGSIPVVMLTTSQAEEDVRNSYAQHASGYVVKPVGFENFLNAIRAFEDFWMTFVRFPPRA
ncbi:response regulator [Deinococcus aetherius]|uniref:Response regulator n=1 Tax=Deinococcus aetherius TaxID=200252 RepID=A0ABM8AA19_9DEIO|nr:response regulator [Deinococcus aetherius]BDP40604.1 response regulator [Deinococcus aetherius]